MKLLLIFGCIIAFPAMAQTIYLKDTISFIRFDSAFIVNSDTAFKQRGVQRIYLETGKEEDWMVTVTIKKFNTVGVTEKIDASLSPVFTGTWRNGPTTAVGWFGNTITHSNVPGNTATWTFNGKKVELWAESNPLHGSGAVSIDGGVETIVSYKQPTQLPRLIYTSGNLAAGSHTIRLRCVSGYVLADYLMVTK